MAIVESASSRNSEWTRRLRLGQESGCGGALSQEQDTGVGSTCRVSETVYRAAELMAAASRQFPWSNRTAYAAWLAQTYFYVRHSTRLLALAAARFKHGEVGERLHARFAAHLRDEKGHERAAEADWKRLGQTGKPRIEMPETRMLYETQYYKIEHRRASSLLGYILPLELLASGEGPAVLAELESRHGSDCVSFVRIHAGEDAGHVQQGLRVLAWLSDTEGVEVEQNAEQTATAYIAMLRAVAASSLNNGAG